MEKMLFAWTNSGCSSGADEGGTPMHKKEPQNNTN
jgi:hypothetical protein